MNSTTIPIKILSINVGRSSAAHEIALNVAFELSIDVLLVQEPYIFRDISRKITRKHPSFECFSPTDQWITRPRVMSYIRKDSECKFYQERPILLRDEGKGDLLFLSIQPPRGAQLLIGNIYNAPPGATLPGAGVDSLLSLTSNFTTSNMILAGDFNLHHKEWHPSFPGPSSHQAQVLIDWLEIKGLTLISEIDVPTHNRGNVLDLCFATRGLVSKGIISAVQNDLDVTSDHLPILISIPSSSFHIPPIPKPRLGTIDEKVFSSLLAMQIHELNTSTSKSESQIDILTEKLIAILKKSLAGSTKNSLPHTKGQPWWDHNCKVAKKRFKDISRYRTPTRDDRKAFRKVVKYAKASFFAKKLDEARNAKDAYEISKWHKSRGNFRTPPLVDPLNPKNEPAQTLEDKRDVIARNLLCNQSGTEDISYTAPTVSITTLPFPHITEAEVTRAILGVGTSTPGEDGISTAILRLAWPQISSTVINIFQSCLEVGYHPRCFRTAILAIIEKPNKIDRSSPRSYRPIALLSVLGKGLERLIAKRMAWIAIKYKVLASHQFGALPLRSYVDLTTCLTHDVETALVKGQTASVATLDIKGAFDAVLPGRLIRRLREQGWPNHVCKWASSFLSDRKICIRLDGEVGPTRRIQCGIPQGSPISPILFMLYISPLFKLNRFRKTFGYADDVAILEVSPTLEENTRKLEEAINEALAWSSTEGLTFDSGKSDLLHFSRKRRDRDKNPQVTTNELSIAVNQRDPSLKWLGIHFDKKLTFKQHACIQASKALKVANALRCFGNTIRGVSPKLSKQVIEACVLPIAHFGAPTWWPGKNRVNRDRIISNRVGTHLKMIDKAHRVAARSILPVFRTTSTTALFRESGLSPAELTLDSLTKKAAMRIRRLDSYHPLYLRSRSAASGPAITRFTRALKMIPPSEEIDPLSTPPWETPHKINSSWTSHPNLSVPQARRRIFFRNFLNNIPKNDILVYTDGSKSPDGKIGTGFAIYQMDRQITIGGYPLGPHNEIQDAEAHAILFGICAALSLSTTRFANDLWVLTDSQKVVKILSENTNFKTSAKVFEKIVEADKKWKTRQRLPHTIEGQIRVCWIPGHAGIKGNELADLEAKKAALIPCSENQTIYSLASLEKWYKETTHSARQEWWNIHAPSSYTQLEIREAPSFPKELLLTRKALGRIIALRTGHGDFASYHNRFGHTGANLHCRCGSLKTQLHCFYCRILRHRGHRPSGSINFLIHKLFGTSEGAITLVKWLDKTKFFEEICIR